MVDCRGTSLATREVPSPSRDPFLVAKSGTTRTGSADMIIDVEDGVFAEHWDVLQFEATAEESKSGLPMFGDAFPTRA